MKFLSIIPIFLCALFSLTNAQESGKYGNLSKTQIERRLQTIEDQISNQEDLLQSLPLMREQVLLWQELSKRKPKLIFYAYPGGTRLSQQVTSHTGHCFVGFMNNGKMEEVKGFMPKSTRLGGNGSGRNLVSQEHLQKFAKITFMAEVDTATYVRAKNYNKSTYILGLSDCVSYCAKIAAIARLKTPTTIGDMIVRPMEYVKFLEENNSGVD